MSPFDYLLISHLIGDYLFQTSWMAMYKAKRWGALFVHCFVYTVIIYLGSWIGFGGLSLWGILFVFITHILIDRRTFILWWVKTIMRTTGKEANWLSIIVDQTFHLIILAIALKI